MTEVNVRSGSARYHAELMVFCHERSCAFRVHIPARVGHRIWRSASAQSGDREQEIPRNLADCYDGFLFDTRYVLVDRDTNFLALRGVLKGSDTKAVLLPPQSPNLKAHIERYMRSMKSECLNRMIFFGEKSLRRALTQFEAHYHAERNHQGLRNNLIEPGDEVGRVEGNVACRNRLGGTLRYYYHQAA